MSGLADTGRRLAALGITRATLLIDSTRARNNIARFAGRARRSGVTLRPHFKTHQSAAVAGWFRDAGVTCATVSSVGQAAYFADHGWNDLTVAIGLNPRELPDYADLARRVTLGVTIDHPEQVAALVTAGIRCRVWIEVDPGYGRAGLDRRASADLSALVRSIEAAAALDFAGLLTHAGHSYGQAPDRAAAIFAEARDHLVALRNELAADGLPAGRISAGDTPGFAAVADWSGLDEARPGNFVFHDLMQLMAGACRVDELACALAAPVIGVYPQRGQAVVHAGAVHLSKDAVATPTGPLYGKLLTLDDGGFADLVPEVSLTGLSQEHGVLDLAGDVGPDDLHPGDLVLIVPAHSCLACEQADSYLTASGEVLTRYHRR